MQCVIGPWEECPSAQTCVNNAALALGNMAKHLRKTPKNKSLKTKHVEQFHSDSSNFEEKKIEEGKTIYQNLTEERRRYLTYFE